MINLDMVGRMNPDTKSLIVGGTGTGAGLSDFLKTNLQKIYFKNISLSNFIFLSYFTIYLAGSIYFKHFAFDSYEKWKIFLNVQ